MAPHPATLADPVEPDAALTFDRIYEDYRSRILRYLTGLVGPADAEDLTQLVFIKVSAALSDFRGDASLGTWIYRIARNAALDWRRTVSRSSGSTDDIAMAEYAEALVDDHESTHAPDEALIRHDMQQCLGRVVQDLPEGYRDVVTLRDVDGLSNADVAETLGLSLATVKIRLHRARGQLRRTITDRCLLSRDRRHGLTCERKPPA